MLVLVTPLQIVVAQYQGKKLLTEWVAVWSQGPGSLGCSERTPHALLCLPLAQQRHLH